MNEPVYDPNRSPRYRPLCGDDTLLDLYVEGRVIKTGHFGYKLKDVPDDELRSILRLIRGQRKPSAKMLRRYINTRLYS